MKKGLFYLILTLLISVLIIINCDGNSGSGGSSGGGGGGGSKSSNSPEINIKENITDISNGTTGYSIGSTQTGNPLDVVFTIENTGSANLTLSTSPAVDLSGDVEYSLLEDASTDIADSDFTTFTIRFNAAAANTYTTEIIIANNDSDEGDYRFSLTADASDAPEPEINIKESITDISNGTTGYSIGSTEAGTPLDVVFTIENTGLANLTLSTSPAVDLSGDAEYSLLEDASTDIADSDFTTFTIRFDAAAVGTYTTELIIANNDSDEGDYRFTITADAAAPPAPDIDVEYLGSSITSPTGKQSLGKVTKGTTEYFTFKIKNTGTADLNLTGTPIVSITGSSTFGIDLSGTATTIAQGGETTFVISFSPVVNSKVLIDVEIENNDPDSSESPYMFEINGQGQN